MSLSSFISQYSWAIIVVGVIAWVSFMIVRKPKNVNGSNPDGLSRLGMAIEKAKVQYAANSFMNNLRDMYGPKPEPVKQDTPKQEPVKDEPKVSDKPNNLGIADIKQSDIIKPLDF